MSNSNPTSSTDTEPAAELIGVAAPTVATELRRRRELLGWSQAEAARRSGVSRTVINEIEAGKRMPHTATYEKLRGALGLSLPTAQALLQRRAPAEVYQWSVWHNMEIELGELPELFPCSLEQVG